MCGPAAARGSIMNEMRFVIRTGCAAELPLYGTSVIFPSPPAVCTNSNVANCCGLPSPVVPYVILPALSLMYLMSSCSDFTGDCELTTKTYGVRCVSETGAKSLMVSNGRSVNKIGLVAMLAAAMVFDAPGRLSTITCLPSDTESLSPSKRATMSLGPPVVTGTTKRMLLVGYADWLCAASG